jgi:LytS/YehU family sensor histidine kinase
MTPALPAQFFPTRKQLAMVVGLAFAGAVLLIPVTHNTFIELVGETLFVSLMLLFAFTAQFLAVLLAAMLSPLFVQLLTFGGNFAAFAGSRPHVRGYVLVTICAGIVGLLVAMGALLREREARARAQLLQFELEREQLERQAANARLQLMTAQVQPHFLLNTLANVQELVESGSPRAVPVFRSLIAYLRAAMPHLQKDGATLADEERLVGSYLDLMHMRMPDRLTFAVAIAPELRTMRFPPMALLTLVENAIRHGIDPAPDGGKVEVGGRADAHGGAHLWVADSGVGISEKAATAGTGIANLQERLRVFFGDAARLELSEPAAGGVRADVYLPAHAGATA